MATSARGFTVWLTGLPCSGKSTISQLVTAELERLHPSVELLDGDVVRTRLSRDLGYSRTDRDLNIERIGWVASRLTRHGVAVVVAAISPYREARRRARSWVEEFGQFVEVWVNASVEECARRDVKGLYARAFAGELTGLTGVDDPYEPPERAEVVLDTETQSPDESTRQVIAALAELGVLPNGSAVEIAEL